MQDGFGAPGVPRSLLVPYVLPAGVAHQLLSTSLSVVLSLVGSRLNDSPFQVEPYAAPQEIRRIEELPSVTIKISPPADVPLEQTMREIEAEIVGPARAAGLIGPTGSPGGGSVGYPRARFAHGRNESRARRPR